MERINLRNINVADNHFDHLTIFLDKDGSLVILPMLYSIYLETAGEVIKVSEYIKRDEFISELRSEPIADTSISTYIGHVFGFFQYIEEKSDIGLAPNVHQSYSLHANFINEYLNKYLPSKLTSSSLGNHQASIKSYFNFLAKLGLISPPQLKVSREARKRAFDNNQIQNKINFISTKERNYLRNKCKTKRDRLLLRMGFEVGLRTSENLGLILKHKNREKGYLLELFQELEDPEKQDIDFFRYWLDGKFTKGGKSRYIFFSRELLADMKDYYGTERAQVLSKAFDECYLDALFLNDDQRYFGQPIKENLGTTIFKKYLKQIDWMDQNLSYHDLRHTFATELYHAEVTDSSGNQTGSQNKALITVALRLGHAMGKDGKPAAVTTRYIRLMEIMLSIEGTKICPQQNKEKL